MNSSKYSPLVVQEIFRSLLASTTPPNSSATSHQRLSVAAATSDHRLSTAPQPPPPPPETLTEPPPKNSIRFIENDQNDRREKYDGHRWRLVCIWNTNECTNLAYRADQLCAKHSAIRRNKDLPIQKRKPLLTNSSLPIMNQYNHNNIRPNHNNHNNIRPSHNNHNNIRHNYNNNHHNHKDDDDDDIEILEDYCKSPTIRRSMNSNIKSEAPDFNVFSVDYVNDNDRMHSIKSEPMASSSYRSTITNDIEYVSSKTRSNGLNIAELMAKNIPPLTDFEEDFLANRLIQNFPTSCSMLDAQLYLHNEAIGVVKQNYRLKMDNVAPEYFYDFLLRHPRVALHYSNWFLRCKSMPPTTGCPIDTKVWTLSMIVRGATNSDNMNDD